MKKTARAGRAAAAGRGGRGIAGPVTLLGRGGTGIPESPERANLEAFPNTHRRRDYWIEFDCPEFTSVCPVTGQPDFGRITVRYVADRLCIESKSLKLYLHSFRSRGAFHEEVVNTVLDDIVRAVKPRRATVIGDFNPRGGIAIRVEASYP